MRRWIAFVALVLVLCVTSIGVAAAPPIKIGFLCNVMSMTGQQIKDVGVLAEEELNKGGGLLGRPVKVIVEDSQGLPTSGVTAARKLIFNDDVIGIVGCTQSTVIFAIEPLCNQEKVILMGAGSASQITQLGNPWLVRVREYDELAAAATVNHAVARGFKRFAVFHNADQFGVGGLENIKDALAKHGLEPVAVEAHNTKDKDMTAQLVKIKKANPDVIITWTHGEEHAITVRQVRQLLPNVEYYGSMGLTQPSTLQMAAGSAEGYYSSSPYSSHNPDPDVQAFVKRHEDAFGYPPEVFSVLYYDAAMMLGEAIRRAGTYDKEKIRVELRSIKDFKGVSGITYTFDESGEAFNQIFIVQIKDDIPQIVDKVYK